MVKKLALGIALFVACIGVRAQDSSFFEIGINTIPLLRTMYAPDPSSDARISPYMLTVEKSFGKIGLRAGAGLNNSRMTEEPGDTNGNTEFRNDSTGFDMRIGLVYYARLRDRWSFRCGVDFRTGRSTGLSNTVFVDSQGNRIETINETEETRTGFAPFVFIQYHISPRVSLATELAFSSTSTDYTLRQENSQFPDFNALIQRSGQSTRIEAPTALFLIVRF